MYFFINNTLDFKRSLAWQAVTNSSLISFPDQGSEKLRRYIDTIFQDIWTIEQTDPSMVRMYLDSIESLLKSLKKLYLGFLFVRENKRTEDGDIAIGHYFLVNQSAYICCGDRSKELIHRMSSKCPRLDEALQKSIRTNDDLYVWVSKGDVDSEYEGTPNLCPDCQKR